MDVLPKSALLYALAISTPLWIASSLFAQPATVQAVALVNGPSGFEVEIVCTAPITPQTQLVTDPARLVVDFPNAVPGSGLRNLPVHRGDVKDVRVGLFAANPPVTRVVLDLTGSLRYEVLPAGNKTLVKIGQVAALVPAVALPVAATPAPQVLPPPPVPLPKVVVRFQNGLLSIVADRASLADVLTEVQHRTGADIPIPPGTDQELVVVRVEPLPVGPALASLLNGSRFNFILVGSAENPYALKSVILTPKTGLPEGQVISAVSPGNPRVSPVVSASPPLPPDDDESDDQDDPQAARPDQEPPPQDTPLEPPHPQ